MDLNLSLNDGRFHYGFPEFREYVDAPIDGTSAPLHAPAWQRVGFAMSIRPEGPRQMHIENSFEGRVIRKGTLKLSEDGRTVISESWVADRPDERDSVVYEKVVSGFWKTLGAMFQ